MKTVVLGAGVVGTSTAYFLAKAGHEVEVIERREAAAMETSSGNGGVIHASEVEPWSQPGMPSKILKWLGKEDAPLLVRYGAIPHMWRWGLKFIANCTPERFRRNALTNLKIALHSLKVLQQIRAETGIEYDVRTSGLMKVFTDPAALASCLKSAEFLATGGLVFEALDAAACVRREPALAANTALVGGVYFPREEVGDCHKFTTGLAKRCAELGVRFHFGTTISHLERSGGRIAAVRTGNGAMRADSFVAALASYTPLILRSVGIDVPIYPVKGVTITVPGDAWPGRPQLPIADDARIFGLVPLGDRLRVSGSAEVARYDTTPSPARCRAICNNVISVFPEFAKCLDPATAKYWAGVRPVTPTGTPILDRSPIPNLYIAAGHGHLGWTMGCGSGQVMAAMVSGAATDIDMRGFGLADH
ncbi:MAG TPA: D-amino acid dehydrogenase [Candidatus Cybelea sp.]|nr:D-amino acid dehydrogenase [Candidatus Cybelea sp.]